MPEERRLLAEGVRLAIAMMRGSQNAKCAELSISPTTMQKWTSGAAVPSEARLARLSRKSGVAVEVIRRGGHAVLDDAVDG